MPGTVEAGAIIPTPGDPGTIAEGIASGTATVGYVPVSTGVGAKPAWGPAGGEAVVVADTVEVDLGSAAVSEGKFTITDAGISATSKVLCWQAPGPYTGKGTLADEAAMSPVQVVAVEALEGSAVVYWQTPPEMVVVPLEGISALLGGGTSANNGTNRDLRFVACRRGFVVGNVKFTYTIFS